MTLIVQNNEGTTLGANGYIDSAFADTYFSDIGINDSLWLDLDQDVKDASIVAASNYINIAFANKVKGRRLTQDQNTIFPRSGIVDYDGYSVEGIPNNLKIATSEYARRASVGELAPDAVVDDAGLPIKSKREKIGPLDETIVYQDGVFSPAALRKYPAADLFLSSYMANPNAIMRG